MNKVTGFFAKFTLVSLSATILNAAAGTDFDRIDTIVNNLGGSTQKSVGIFVEMIIAFLPLIGLVGVSLVTYKHQKEKSDREDGNKLAIAVGASMIIGSIIGVLTDALIGAVLLQDSSKGLEVLSSYWKTALGL